MMRLQRVGRKNDPSFRIVVTDSRNAPQSGKYKEMIGHWDPKQDAASVNAERAQYWLNVGVQTSGTVHNLLVARGVIEGKKRNVLPRKAPVSSGENGGESSGS